MGHFCSVTVQAVCCQGFHSVPPSWPTGTWLPNNLIGLWERCMGGLSNYISNFMNGLITTVMCYKTLSVGHGKKIYYIWCYNWKKRLWIDLKFPGLINQIGIFDLPDLRIIFWCLQSPVWQVCSLLMWCLLYQLIDHDTMMTATMQGVTLHYNDVIMGISHHQLMIVYSTIYSGTDQRKHLSFT